MTTSARTFGISLAAVSLILLCAQSVPQVVQGVLASAPRHYSADRKKYVQVAKYTNQIPADASGIFFSGEKTQWYLKIPSLVGVGFVEWSPNSQYLLVDNGTYAIRGFVVVELGNAKLVGTIEHLSNEYGWKSPNVLASTTRQGSRTNDIVDRFGVSFFTISQNGVARRDVLIPNELTDYHLLVKGGVMKVIRTNYKDTGTESPWKRYKIISQVEIALADPK